MICWHFLLNIHPRLPVGLQYAYQAIRSAETTNDSTIIPHLYNRVVYFHFNLDNKENEDRLD